ncbi:MAG: adenylate/guanylate cyclase domain-containing protein [Candidatus Riflebacteria bacterium]|nr:adenylate/guanylate cyclase domain-containing protein [Candidatus Riflebacteria bacterium]
MKQQTDKTPELKTIKPDRPVILHLFLFWLIVFVLPVLSSKLLINAYIAEQKNETEFLNRSELRREMELFMADLDLANRLKQDIGLVERLLPHELEKAKEASAAELCAYIKLLLKKNSLYQPALIAVYDPVKRETEVIRSNTSIVSTGNKSMEIMLSCLLESKTKTVSSSKSRLYQQICRSIFGDFLRPADQPGTIESGFITKDKGERLFIYYNYLQEIGYGEQKPIMMLFFEESSTGLRQLVKQACRQTVNPSITRSSGLLRAIANRDFFYDRQNRLHYAAPLAPELLRIGSHKGRDWYTISIEAGVAQKIPARVPFAIVSRSNFEEKNNQPSITLLNLALLGLIFIGTALVKEIISNRSSQSSINRKLTLSILLSTILPFAALLITAHKFTEQYNLTLIHNRLRNMSNDLFTLEANINNNDLQQKTKLNAFVEQIRANVNESDISLKKLLDSTYNKLAVGYIFFRSDGLLLEKLPADKGTSGEDRSKLMLLREVTLAQFYDVFSQAEVLQSDFHSNAAKIPGFKNWRAISGHLIASDRDNFCLRDGDYFPIKITDRPYVSLSTHNLFCEKGSNSPWGFLMLFTDNSKFAENYLADMPGSSFASYEDDTITHSAIFRVQDNASYHFDTRQSWPVNASKDKLMLQAVGRLNSNNRETAWYNFDKDRIASLIAARTVTDLPFVLVSRTDLTDTAMSGTLLPVLVLIAVFYLLALIKLLGTVLSDTFVRPVNMMMQGLESLDNYQYPVIVDGTSNELGNLIGHFNNMVEGMRQRKMLERFISEEVSETIASTDSHSLDGRLVYRAIMFIHIRKFEDICENFEPEAVISLLNLYFSTLEPVVVARGGQIDKYIADAIMISFASERTNSQPETAAATTAEACMKKLPKLNEKLLQAGLPTIKTGIGIAAGQVISGQIGAYRGRKDFTLIGDAVNLAARLEALSHFDDMPHILVSQQIKQNASEVFAFRFHNSVKVKGKNESVEVFELPESTNE